jgi:hypothetical protein
MSKNESLEFSLATNSRPVVLLNPDGSKQKAELREMTVAERETFSQLSKARWVYNDKGEVVGINKFEGMSAELLTRCLFKIDDEGKATAVSAAEVAKWPSSATAKLVKAANEINRLKEAEEEVEPKKA